MKILNIIQKIVKIARVLVIIAISMFFGGAVYELILVGTELLTHGSKAIDMNLITHALEHVVHFVANGILLLFVFRYLRHEIHDGTPYTTEGAKELREIGVHIIVHPVITASIITIIYVLCGRDFPAFFTESSYIGILFGVVLVFVSLILRYGAELEKKEKNEEKEE
ncbi:MAG: hypothetical protein IKJ68_13270 [Clostridia bacterium]|nr:hypothetical protein [Clostridia bacterium]